MGNGQSEHPYGDAFEAQAASLRESVFSWARENAGLQPPEFLAHLLNLAFQVAFLMGSDQDVVRQGLVNAVHEASALYGNLAAGPTGSIQ